MQHHSAVTIAGSRYDRLPAITTPTLVVHGTADRLIPVQHGEKLVQLIPNAEPLWLEGVGHVFPYPNLNSVIATILAHLDNPRP
jgi:pimeloyl-ACP methyl ester carboxylesterase